MIAIPFIIFLFVFLSNYRLNIQNFSIGGLLLISYLISYGSNIIAYYSGIVKNSSNLNFFAILYLTFFTILPILPYLKVKTNSISEINIENRKLYNLLELFLIILGLFCVFYFTQYVIQAFTGDILGNRLSMNENREILENNGLLNTIACIGANFYPISIACFFLRITVLKNRNIAIWLLLSSFSYVFYVAATVGRDGYVFWIINFLFYFLLFKNQILKERKKFIVILGSSLFAIFIFGFTIITKARFGDRYNFVEAILLYLGQNVVYFNDFYNAKLSIYTNGYSNFPYLYTNFTNLFGIEGYSNKSIHNEISDSLLTYGSYSWTFGTFLKSLIVDFGKIGTIVFVLIIKIIISNPTNKIRKTGVLNFSDILILGIIFQFLFNGIFYNTFMWPATDIYIINLIILIILFKYKFKFS